MFTKAELEAILGLIEFTWKNGGVRDPNVGKALDGIGQKSIGILKALDTKKSKEDKEEEKE